MKFCQLYDIQQVFYTCPRVYYPLVGQEQSNYSKKIKWHFTPEIYKKETKKCKYLSGPGLKSRIRFNTYFAAHSPTWPALSKITRRILSLTNTTESILWNELKIRWTNHEAIRIRFLFFYFHFGLYQFNRIQYNLVKVREQVIERNLFMIVSCLVVLYVNI